MRHTLAQSLLRSVVVLLTAIALLPGCDDGSTPPAASPGPSATKTTAGASTPTRTSPPSATATVTATSTRPAATRSPTPPATQVPTAGEATASPTEPVFTATASPTEPVLTATLTPTPTATATSGTSSSYVGDYTGSDASGTYGTRFHVDADGSADGFLDFLTAGSAASLAEGDSGAADISVSYEANGQVNLDTGAYQLTGNFFGNDFTIAGQLPASPDATGTLNITVLGSTSQGTLSAGTGPTPTATPGCDTADLQMAFSNVSGDFNGTSTNFVVERMNTAIEQKAPGYIAGINEIFNSTFNGTACEELRNIQISLFASPGGLAAGQSFTVNNEAGPGALVYYGQQVSGNDSVWSSSTGSVVIDAVDGSVVTLRVVDAAMTVTAGGATGSFTLNVSGHVNNFTRQLD